MVAVHRPIVLIVDDDVRAGRRLARLLEDDGFAVEVTTDGASAIARLARSPLPDAVVTDHFMADVDGLTVSRFARSQRPSIATVIMTGHAELIGAPAKTLTPPPVVLEKPVSYDLLLQALHDLLPKVA